MTAHGVARGRDHRSTGDPVQPGPGDVAYRRAWWALALYPLSFVLAFVVGEGLYTLLTGDASDPEPWQVVLAGTPALLVFVVPGGLAVWQGRRAMRLGRPDGQTPALVGALIGACFVALNLVSYVAGLIVG